MAIFRCGANEIKNSSYDGKTVADVIPAIQDMLNIDASATIYVNGVSVSSSTIVCAEDDIEFVKASGTKGF